ncbi:transcriptional regulator GcvA [Acuticoccus sp. MNP-M23]|uniref:transcriptional regulator GcvA n=1 Tax=Acuticoccus sp. MNP-M23 TaxID=3072793 RepID=UPI0028161F86|nr:transcriptional regulator GcvA [Acuticoccus sp. MNP-M23]WMS41432.1 transcriptional regulator GcvA [Acuticoccus sp. MNP-M23]
MRRRLPSLNALRVFEAAARKLSFSAAADELNVTQGAVSRQIKTLEAEIGVPLFVRHVRRIALTADGADLYPGVRGALDELERSVARVEKRKASGVLTVSALPTFAMSWLMPRLEDFSTRNPTIEVHLATSIGAVNFSRDEVDLAIRVGRIDASDDPDAPRIDLKMIEDSDSLRSERLMVDELVPVAAPDFFTGAAPVKPEDLLAYPLIHNATRGNAWQDYFNAAGLTVTITPEEPKFGHYFMVMAAARRGDGVAVIPRVLVEEDIASGRLVPAIAHTVRSAGSYYLLGREHQWDFPMIKAFREWIAAQAAPYETAEKDRQRLK